MLQQMVRLRKRFLSISPEEATFARRGFIASDPATGRHLEHAGRTFLAGYHVALEDGGVQTLARRLDAIEPEFRGFGFEGAAMALALLDRLSPRRHRVREFLAGPGGPHTYMVHVGVGWALARLHRRIETPPASLDPLLGWLAVDGYGFHEGYFYPHRYVREQRIPHRVASYAARTFDQGLGRSLWFVEGGDVGRIPATIASFHSHRHADLWSGVGLASSYAGGVDEVALHSLRAASGPFLPCLAQGAVFAARARQRAGNQAAHTDAACRAYCGVGADQAAGMAEAALEDLRVDGTLPAYEVWRRRIQAQFARGAVTV